MEENINATNGGNPGAEGNNANGMNNHEGQGNVQEGAQGAQNDTGTAKTYNEKEFQSEVDKRVTEALKTAQEKWQTDYDKKIQNERDEAARLAKMSTEERAKAEFDKQKEAFDKERESYNRERLEFECTKQLAAESLPVEFASMLTGTDADVTKSNIETFKSSFMKAVEAAVTERLKGSPPKTQTQTNTETDPFLMGFGK